jgi:hypothetical protein
VFLYFFGFYFGVSFVLVCDYYSRLLKGGEDKDVIVKKLILFPCLLMIMPIVKFSSHVNQVREFYDFIFENNRRL